MRTILYVVMFFASALFICSCKKAQESLQSELRPQISEAYKGGDWKKVIFLTDSLRNNGIHYTDYIGNKGLDIAYYEALISTGKAEKAIAEMKNHVANINPRISMLFIP